MQPANKSDLQAVEHMSETLNMTCKNTCDITETNLPTKQHATRSKTIENFNKKQKPFLANESKNVTI